MMTEEEERRLLACLVSAMVVIVMSNHPVTCGGQVAVQNEGGAIGLSLTCDVAKTVMTALDTILVRKMTQNNLSCWLNHTYVDDKTM